MEYNQMSLVTDWQLAAHWRKGTQSKQLKSPSGFYVMERSDAIQLFRQEKADLIECLPDGRGWRAFKVRDEFKADRKEVRDLTSRLYASTLRSSIA